MGIGTNGTAPGEGPLLWQLAYPYLLLSSLRWYGTVNLARRHWPHVKRLTDYLPSWDPADLATHCLGDYGSIATKGDFRGGTPDKELEGLCSQNHAMFSSYVQWLYQALAGITVPHDALGCNKVLIRPFFSGRTDRVEASVDTPLGAIRAGWTRSSGVTCYSVTLPEGIEAEFLGLPDGGQHDPQTNTWTFVLA